MRYREFVLSPYGVIKIKSLGYTFEPTLIGKHEKQLNGFDDRIISLYSRGLSPHSHSKHNKVTHLPESDKITVLALLESLLHAGKTSDSERTVLHRKAAW
ncbi:hypothetical protein [Symbiopectobacterium purcellii]|uniref:hypothetical protein n=1 Tax=Symbiopectobacterium purcellii TaxID=2871826 RepID=UPI003F8609D0